MVRSRERAEGGIACCASSTHARDVQPAEAVDPVCGMTVALGDGTETIVHEGAVYAFCSAHCRHRFESEPARFAPAST